MSPSRAEQVGPFTRALREALESAAGVERAAAVLTRALNDAGVSMVPEELEGFRRFIDGPLRFAVDRHLAAAESEAIFELMGHVLWMATSDVQSRRQSADSDDASGERSVEPAPFRVPALPPTPVPPVIDASPPARASNVMIPAAIPAALPRGDEVTTDLPIVPPPPELPRERRQSITLGRVSRPDLPIAGVLEIGPSDSAHDSSSRKRPVRLEVLVLTLDPLLVFETDNGLAGRGRVTSIATAAELARAASSAGSARLVVIVDSALPSIDLPTFAPISGSLPPGTRIVLWGVDDRQKQRLSVMFPAAKDWIASGRAASTAEVILDLVTPER